MADFKKKGFGGGRDRGGFGRDFKSGGFKKGGFGGGFPKRDRGEGGEREMFKATCSSCGKACEVPFRPTGERPVLCSDCFKQREDFPSRDTKRETSVYRKDSGQVRHNSSEVSTDLTRQLASISAKLDTLIALFSRPAPMPLHNAEKEAEKTEGVPKKPRKQKKD